MIEVEQRQGGNEHYRNRRAYERYNLNASGGSLKYMELTLPCDVIDISIGGCCLRTAKRFTAGNLATVEVEIPIFGMLLHMMGVTQWVSGDNLIGVRFLHSNARSKNQLAGLLTCLVDQSAVDVVTEAVVAASTDPLAPRVLDLEIPQTLIQNPEPAPAYRQRRKKSKRQCTYLRPPASSPPIEPVSESAIRVGESRLPSFAKDDCSAELFLLKDGSRVQGTLSGLNLEGCIFHTLSRFEGSIYTRVEAEFHMRGLCLRLVGVIEEIVEKQSLAIRFLDMSRRRQEELAQLLEELREESDKQED